MFCYVVPFGVHFFVQYAFNPSQYWHPLIFAYFILFCLLIYLFILHYRALSSSCEEFDGEWCPASFCFNYFHSSLPRGIIFASSRRDRYGWLNIGGCFPGVESNTVTSKPSNRLPKIWTEKHFLMMGNPCFNVNIWRCTNSLWNSFLEIHPTFIQ